MSWGDHLNIQLVSKGVTACALIGATNGCIWADHSSGLTPPEGQAIAKSFIDPQQALESGISVGGTKFTCTSASEDQIIAKKDNRGLHCQKSNKAIVLAFHDETMTSHACASIVGQAAEYFKGLGY